LQSKRVLVVDDEEQLRNLLALICRRAGYEVDMATDGEQALRLIDQNDYLVMVLDLQMPRVNGFDVANRILSRKPRPNVLVLTALPPSATLGLPPQVVQAVIRKPFDVELLAGLVQELAEAALAERERSSDGSAKVISFPNS
jgi:DNA-binding response OmpR family regulator